MIKNEYQKQDEELNVHTFKEKIKHQRLMSTCNEIKRIPWVDFHRQSQTQAYAAHIIN